MSGCLPSVLPRSRRAFSLVELLVVLAIIAILMTLMIPAFNTMGAANRIANAAMLVVGQFDLARQTALAENRMIEVRLYAIPNGSQPAQWRALQIVGADGTPLNRIQWLPDGAIFDPEPSFSTLLSPGNALQGNAPVAGHGNCDYKALFFTPSGSTSLPAAGAPPDNDAWFVTVRNATDQPDNGWPAKNFATIVLDPVTGRVRTLRP